MLDVAFIGCGSIARDIAARLTESPAIGLSVVGYLSRSDASVEQLNGVAVVRSIPELLGKYPRIVVELASQAAVQQYGADVLRTGVDLLIASTGALANIETYDALRDAARTGGARLMIPAGAVGGLDVIGALRLGGLRSVVYRSRKPPRAWTGTSAEDMVQLGNLTEPATFFSGTARDAALMFPQNANVAATVALAGLGFEATRVELVADPSRNTNQHEIEAIGDIGRTALVIESKPSMRNPKTSALTAYSILRALLNESGAIVV